MTHPTDSMHIVYGITLLIFSKLLKYMSVGFPRLTADKIAKTDVRWIIDLHLAFGLMNMKMKYTNEC